MKEPLELIYEVWDHGCPTYTDRNNNCQYCVWCSRRLEGAKPVPEHADDCTWLAIEDRVRWISLKAAEYERTHPPVAELVDGIKIVDIGD